jgi:hypothetical protein
VADVLTLPIDVEIREAWAELLDARQDFTHSPNGKTQHAAMCAEAKVNRLLERRFAARG